MSESPQYEAFRAFAREVIALEVLKAKTELKEILTREAPKIVEGPPGKDGKDGANGTDGKDGQNGIDGKPGERGSDGIATREELQAEFEKRVAELNVRTFADIYQGVYKPGESYTRSNFTTWGGSLWLALVDTKAKPGETPDWKLVVKK